MKSLNSYIRDTYVIEGLFKNIGADITPDEVAVGIHNILRKDSNALKSPDVVWDNERSVYIVTYKYGYGMYNFEFTQDKISSLMDLPYGFEIHIDSNDALIGLKGDLTDEMIGFFIDTVHVTHLDRLGVSDNKYITSLDSLSVFIKDNPTVSYIIIMNCPNIKSLGNISISECHIRVTDCNSFTGAGSAVSGRNNMLTLDDCAAARLSWIKPGVFSSINLYGCNIDIFKDISTSALNNIDLVCPAENIITPQPKGAKIGTLDIYTNNSREAKKLIQSKKIDLSYKYDVMINIRSSAIISKKKMEIIAKLKDIISQTYGDFPARINVYYV